MKYICTHACICRGVHTRPGTVLDLTDEELAQDNIKASFAKCADQVDAPAKDEDKPDAHGMTKAAYRAKLDQLNVPYELTESAEDLNKKLRKATSTQSRKADKH